MIENTETWETLADVPKDVTEVRAVEESVRLRRDPENPDVWLFWVGFNSSSFRVGPQAAAQIFGPFVAGD